MTIVFAALVWVVIRPNLPAIDEIIAAGVEATEAALTDIRAMLD